MPKHRVTRPDEIEMKRRAWQQARRVIINARPDVPLHQPPSTLYEELAIGRYIRQLKKFQQWFEERGLPQPDEYGDPQAE